VSVESGLLLLAVLGFIAYVERGITGAASAIVFNALFGLALAFGLTGELTLLDGLYWIAMADLVAGLVMVFVLRRQLEPEPFVLRLLLFLVPLAIVFALLLPRMDVQLLALGLGIVLVVSGLYLGLRRTLGTWDEETLKRRAVPTGIVGGALSGLYGMAGPVVVVYLAHAGTDPGKFRARSTVIASTLSTTRGVVLIASGAISTEAIIRFGVTAPVVFIGLGVGMWLHPKVGPRTFRFGLGLIVMLSGAILVARTIAG
jgi:uncharacterized membrane protein YfcA